MTDNDFYLMSEEAERYADAHTSAVEPLLERLDRDTHVHVLNPRMISGSYQGKLLEMISRMIRPRRILEVGTYTGYSAICLAKGLAADAATGRPVPGSLVTIEHNPELEKRIRKYIAEAHLEEVVDLRIGEARDILTAFGAPAVDAAPVALAGASADVPDAAPAMLDEALGKTAFDLIFLDADKEHYADYYPLLKRLLPHGGWLLIDNVLWSGKVYDPAAHDRDTRMVRQLNDMVQADPEVENILLPLRDGLTLVRKV